MNRETISFSSYGRVSMIQVRLKKRMGTKGLFFCHPNLLCCLYQMLAVMELSQHLVSSSNTVRLIMPRDARCVGHVKIMLSADCLLAPHSHFAKRARTHLCMNELNASTQAIGCDPSCSRQTHSNRSCADPRNVDTER